MEDTKKLIESLLESATEYGKTSYDLVKLKTLDKTSDIVSSCMPHTIVFVLVASSILFFSLGLAYWIGEILGQIFYGFLVVAAFYILTGLAIHFFLQKWLKKTIRNYIIKQVLK